MNNIPVGSSSIQNYSSILSDSPLVVGLAAIGTGIIVLIVVAIIRFRKTTPPRRY